MLGAVIGTAGHIDHGKTSLTAALTGIDTDRLREEKRRGITIELGFAHLALPSGRRVGVVDVPGHERYIRTMVGGAVGVDLVVMVIAADEGVMPQTREHLDICELLGVERGVVALSKIDAVEPVLRPPTCAAVEAALAGTFLEGAPVVPCSARSGEGLAELCAAIERVLDGPVRATRWPRPLRDPGGVARLPVDRVFTMKGFGSVVTGTLWSGSLRVGDEVELLPAEKLIGKLRGLQIHGAAVERAEAGHRVAVNVSLPRAALARGMTLGPVGGLAVGRVFDAELKLLPHLLRPLRRRSRVLLHAGTRQVDAFVRLLGGESLAPGELAYAEIEAAEPLVLLPGDRFVLRGFVAQPQHGTTLGGGVVLRVLGRRGRRGARTEPALLERNLVAHARGDVRTRTLLEVERAGAAGLDRGALGRRLPFASAALDEALAALASDRAITCAKNLYGVAGALPEAPTAPISSTAPVLSAADRLAERYATMVAAAGLQPPRPSDAAVALGVSLRELEQAIAVLVRQARIARVQTLYFDVAQLDSLRARLVGYLRAHGEITAQEWKELVAASRKFTIPLAEHFDAERVTLRVGDKRRLR